MSFIIHEQLRSSCFDLGDGPVSKILLKNNVDYPWLILVPRIENSQEIDQLPTKCRYLLIDEVSYLSQFMREYFKPNKLNVGTLGNLVSQLHIHLVGRFIGDKLWPHAVWQASEVTPYEEQTLKPLLNHLRTQIRLLFKEETSNGLALS